MEFDNLGNLKPYAVIELDLAQFENKFVRSFPSSATREKLFKNFLLYSGYLKEFSIQGYYQWIDGSFITQKQNPNDIDVVTFIDWKVYNQNEGKIDPLRQLRRDKSFGIDGYFVAIYPESHHRNVLFEADKLQWLYQFGRSRTDHRKGIIQLNFD